MAASLQHTEAHDVDARESQVVVGEHDVRLEALARPERLHVALVALHEAVDGRQRRRPRSARDGEVVRAQGPRRGGGAARRVGRGGAGRREGGTALEREVPAAQAALLQPRQDGLRLEQVQPDALRPRQPAAQGRAGLQVQPVLPGPHRQADGPALLLGKVHLGRVLHHPLLRWTALPGHRVQDRQPRVGILAQTRIQERLRARHPAPLFQLQAPPVPAVGSEDDGKHAAVASQGNTYLPNTQLRSRPTAVRM
ncbi:hypothetical protein ON010_g5453 [Phytophthora cinnamomi]|nr:hypothetical protein ON010_g5453 [Phytophthora cinnamomi]